MQDPGPRDPVLPTKGDQLWLRGRLVGHRVDGPEKVPYLGTIGIVEGTKRGSSKMSVVVKQPARASASSKNRQEKKQ